MHTYWKVDKYLQAVNHNEEVLIERLNKQQEVSKEPEENRISKKMEKHEKKWKHKFIKIWQLNEKMQSDQEESIGP